MITKRILSVVTNGLIMLSFVSFMVSCGESEQPMTVEEKENEELKKVTVEQMMYSIPSPIETALMLQRVGAKFDKDILNKTENVDKYSTIHSRALNLGIYGSDLSYAVTFNKTQEAMLYLKTAKKISDAIGIGNAFGVSSVERMEANLKNKDSLQTIISDSFWEVDAYLKENDRATVAALILAGGWIEGLYIAIKIEENLRKNKSNKEILTRIADQKITLESLISFLGTYPPDEAIKNVLVELNQLKTIFDAIQFVDSDSSATASPNSKVSTVGVTTTATVTEAQIDNIATKIIEIRNRIIG